MRIQFKYNLQIQKRVLVKLQSIGLKVKKYFYKFLNNGVVAICVNYIL
jgi:hypothetical protein